MDWSWWLPWHGRRTSYQPEKYIISSILSDIFAGSHCRLCHHCPLHPSQLHHWRRRFATGVLHQLCRRRPHHHCWVSCPEKWGLHHWVAHSGHRRPLLNWSWSCFQKYKICEHNYLREKIYKYNFLIVMARKSSCTTPHSAIVNDLDTFIIIFSSLTLSEDVYAPWFLVSLCRHPCCSLHFLHSRASKSQHLRQVSRPIQSPSITWC